MPLEMGVAMSHAPSLFLPVEEWPAVHGRLVGDVPQPPAFQEEVPGVVEEYARRVNQAFDTLRKAIEEYRPDALIIVGDDQQEVFGPDSSPSLAVYTGDEVAGTMNIGVAGQDVAENHLKMPCAGDLAQYLLSGLVRSGFDPARIAELRPQGKPLGGLGHAFIRPCAGLGLKDLGIPIIPIFLEAYHPPMPSAARCMDLGRTLRDLLADRPERVAILGSGGLSHDPGGPRAGWIDEPLDRWFLEKIQASDLEALSHLFELESATLSGGTGEIRSWLVVAGALEGVGAEVVDYIPIVHATTGTGFATWQVPASASSATGR